MARFFGSSVAPGPVITAIVGNVTTSDGHAYGLLEPGTLGNEGMATLKVIDDGAGAYVGVYHVYQGTGTHFDVRVATSTDLLAWTYAATLQTKANIPTIGRRADGSFIVGYADENASPSQLRFRRYTTRANLLTGTYADNVLLPQTLASGGGPEDVPNILSVENPMSIAFGYTDGTNNDRNGTGTLTGWSGTGYTTWTTAASTAMDTAVTALGPFAVGDLDQVTYLGTTLTFVEAQTLTLPGPYGAFHIYYWNGVAAVAQSVTTHGGSTEFANPSVSIVNSPGGSGSVLVVCMFLHATGAASGEYGEAIWYKALP